MTNNSVLEKISIKLSSITILNLIKESFIELIPLIVIGSIFTIVNNLPIDAYQNFMNNIFGSDWRNFGGMIWSNTAGILALLLVITLSKKISKHKKLPLAISTTISICCFMILLEPFSSESSGSTLIGTMGIFISIFSTITSLCLFAFFNKFEVFKFKIPDGEVTESTKLSFQGILPALFTILIFGVAKHLFSELLGTRDIFIYFYALIQAPFDSLNNGLPASIIYILLNQVCWFFGIHGSAVTEILGNNIFIPAIDANIASIAANEAATNIFTKPFFDSFVYIGGAGATLCLALALLMFSKKKFTKRFALLTLFMGFFNINEVLVFGIPIVLNPLFAIPFVLVPLILNIISFLATLLGLVPVTVANVHWTAPVFVSGLFTTGSIAGGLLQLFNLFIGVLLYMPFVKLYEAKKYNTLSILNKFSSKILDGNLTATVDESYTNRTDDIGHISRALAYTKGEFVRLINDLKQNILNSSEHSTTLHEISSNLSTDLENINSSLEGCFDGSKRQVTSLYSVNSVLKDFKTNLSTIVSDIEDVGSSADNVYNFASQGEKEIVNVDIAMNNTSKSFKDFSTFMNDTTVSVSKIQELIDSIKNISKKTNILALNATIEASKVGEEGKGFAVVASEIRKLADDTNSILAEIITKVETVNNNLSFMDEAKTGLGEQIKVQENHSKTMIDIFNQIDTLMQSVNDKVSNVKSTTLDIKSQNDFIESSITQSCDISEENLASMDTLVKFSQLLNSISKDMSTTSEQIKTGNDTLKNSISKYTV